MKSKRKIWLGVGAFVVAGSGAVAAAGLAADLPSMTGLQPTAGRFTDTAIPKSAGTVVAQHDHAAKPAEGGEAGEAGAANLPPELAFSVRIALLRGHLLVGDELVKLKQWNAALPHFLHPTEEIYGDLRDKLADYKVAPFEDALKTLADAVKAKKGGNDYAQALKTVHDALATADAGMKEKQADWDGFVVETAIEAIKTAAGEYQQAVVGGRIAKPVEYQDARGFIWQGDRMIESVAAGLQKKDAAALKEVRAGIADLKKVFPAPLPPRQIVKQPPEVIEMITRIELAAGKLM